MSDPTPPAPDASAAPLALLQALILLLETAGSLPGGDRLSIAALGRPDQFDCRLTDIKGVQAVRIRATRSMFLFSRVEALAGELDQDPDLTGGRLWLIGMVHPRLEKVREIGKTTLTKRPYDPEILLQEAATAVTNFRQSQGLPASSTTKDQAVANRLAMHLQSWCSEPRELDLTALRSLLSEAISKASAIEENQAD